MLNFAFIETDAYGHGNLTEGESSIQLTTSIRQLVSDLSITTNNKSIIKITTIVTVSLVRLKVAAKLELLFNKAILVKPAQLDICVD